MLQITNLLHYQKMLYKSFFFNSIHFLLETILEMVMRVREASYLKANYIYNVAQILNMLLWKTENKIVTAPIFQQNTHEEMIFYLS